MTRSWNAIVTTRRASANRLSVSAAMLAPSLVHPARVAVLQAATHTRCAGSRAAPRRASVVSAALPTVFIDGEAGTTGLQVRERLAQRTDLQVVSLPDALRKDGDARKAALNAADAVILCLPDDAAIAAVQLLEPSNTRTVIIDASTAFRTAEGAPTRVFALTCPLWLLIPFPLSLSPRLDLRLPGAVRPAAGPDCRQQADKQPGVLPHGLCRPHPPASRCRPAAPWHGVNCPRRVRLLWRRQGAD